MKETDLYLPVKSLFESLGYTVYGEVKDVDVVAKIDTLFCAIELKTTFSLSLISQGAKRQHLTDFVYVVIPKPSSKVRHGQAYKHKYYLLKRLGIGLIFVDFQPESPIATIQLEPFLQDIKLSQNRSKKRRMALYKEIRERHSNINYGGTNGQIMTAYREAALRLLKALEDGTPCSLKDLRERTGNPKVSTLLQKNHYNWFIRSKRAHYCLSVEGEKALKKYATFLDTFSLS